MTFDEYSHEAALTAIYPLRGENPYYPALGLCGEAGEVAEHIKKVMRDDRMNLTAERQELLKKELGDVLWYVNALCLELGVSLSDVAAANLEKLKSRQERGVLNGSGDNR